MPMYDDDGRPIPTFRPPVNDPNRVCEIYRTAEIVRDANPSDPFAYGRAVLYMKRGLEYPSDIKNDGLRMINARHAANRESDNSPG